MAQQICPVETHPWKPPSFSKSGNLQHAISYQVGGFHFLRWKPTMGGFHWGVSTGQTCWSIRYSVFTHLEATLNLSFENSYIEQIFPALLFHFIFKAQKNFSVHTYKHILVLVIYCISSQAPSSWLQNIRFLGITSPMLPVQFSAKQKIYVCILYN